MIEFKVKMTLQDYRKLNFTVAYKRPITIILTVIGTINIIAYIFYLSGNTSDFLTNPVFNLMFGIFLLLPVPLSIIFNTKKTFNTNKYLQEGSDWTISEEKIKIKGKSFESEYTWSNIYKIIRVGNCILIYQDRIIANFIPIKSFKTNSDYELFWDYAKKNEVRTK